MPVPCSLIPRFGTVRAGRGRAAGFTLLEVIVALALISSLGMGIYGWISGQLLTWERVRQHSMAREDGRSALAFIQQVNPMLAPQGTEELGDLVVVWQARQIDPLQSDRGRLPSWSLYELALYEVTVTLSRAGEQVTVFTLRQVGFRQVKQGLVEESGGKP